MKVVYDTCVYIDFLRSERHREIFVSRNQIRYLSPIVVMELLAGARTSEAQKLLNRLFNPYSRSQRFISLHSNHFYKAGECLAKIQSKRRRWQIGLSHDVLIAVSATSIGATLYTTNKRDFTAISEFVPVKIKFL